MLLSMDKHTYAMHSGEYLTALFFHYTKPFGPADYELLHGPDYFWLIIMLN